ncbi:MULTISPECIES: copper chaperone PCu(A)C [unclassified Minwuia]|jgi:periplasmic copper chaperone A|uniref:copper chaperone PCu(A)C n=2 Tax=unclassified Minwuia TaxID=2618799 RepID=UPI002479729E|nr:MULTISPECIES: copper chaperone PCu(A)C [unclassified Minwuia]
MYRHMTRIIPMLAILLGLGLQNASAHEYQKGDLSILHPYAYATIGAARAGAVFVTLRNDGAKDDALLGVESGDAARAELHTHIHENGRMMMRPVEQIAIPAGGEAKLQPGGDHIMLMGLKAGLQADYSHDLVLIFRDAGRVPIEFVVETRD